MAPKTDQAPAFAPNSEKQARFLSSSAFEVLYGGRVGGGKTFGLIGDSMGPRTWTDEKGEKRFAVEHPRYEGVIIRKLAEDLGEIRRLCEEIYGAVFPGVKFIKSQDTFRFPSGATIELRGLPHVRSHERFKSRSFQWIGWEELTEHESAIPYEYLFSRCRPGNGMGADFPCYIRSTTNPDGPGQAWVKARFRINDAGDSVEPFIGHRETINDAEYVFHREFIRAGIEDNPALSDAYLAQMGTLDEEKKRALVLGRWDVITVPGAIFKLEFIRISDNKRVTNVPHLPGYRVNTFWDLGLNDRMAIWFHQRVGREDRFIDYYENSHFPLSHYADVLDQKRKQHGYMYAMHYLPHDGDHRKPGMYANRTQREMLEDLHVEPIEIVPRIASVKTGIEITRQALPTCLFDEDKCATGITHLKAYRFAFDPKTNTTSNSPKHDEHSNAADAFRQYAQGYFDGGGAERDDQVEEHLAPRPKVKPRKWREAEDPLTNPQDLRWCET